MVPEAEFSDAGIKEVYDTICRAGQNDAGYCAQDDFLKLLARVADGPNLSAADAEKMLLDPKVPRQDKIKLVEDGMTAEEREDLRKVFFDIKAPLSLEMRALAADILDVPLQLLPKDAPLQKGWLALDDNRDVYLGGVNTGCDATVTDLSVPATKGKVSFDMDGNNGRDGCRTLAKLTAADSTDLSPKDRLDPNMRSGVRPGDWLRIHTINYGRTDSSVGPSNWLNVRVSLGKDKDNATVRTGFLQLTPWMVNGAPVEGQYQLLSRSKASRLSEPFAQLQLTNKRTGDRVRVTLDAAGRFPAAGSGGKPIVLAGAPDDFWSIAVTDGANDQAFATPIGTLGVNQGKNEPLPEPVSMVDHLNANGTDRCRRIEVRGKLWGSKGPSPDDVYQGSVGDCWLVCSAAAMAKWAPDALKKMIVDNKDGTYTVTLNEYDQSQGKYVPLEFTVDADLLYKGASPVYGKGMIDADGQTILWWPILEKAFAEYFDGYGAINGNWMSFALETLTGKKPHRQFFTGNQEDAAWQKINELVHNPNAITTTATVAGVDAEGAKRGYVGGHAYTVTGCEDDGKQRWVKVRNPWGYFEGNLNAQGKPDPRDTVDDGEFRMPLEDFLKYYGELEWVDRSEA